MPLQVSIKISATIQSLRLALLVAESWSYNERRTAEASIRLLRFEHFGAESKSKPVWKS